MHRKMKNRAMNILEGMNRKIATIAENLSKKRYIIYHKNGREIACDFIQDRGTYYAVGINQGIFEKNLGAMPNRTYHRGSPAFYGKYEYIRIHDGYQYPRRARCIGTKKYEHILTINKENVAKIERTGATMR